MIDHVTMPDSGRLNLHPDLYTAIYKLAKDSLGEELKLSKSTVNNDNSFWKNYFDDFQNSVSEKYVAMGATDLLRFPNSSYFYNRYKDARKGKLGQVDTAYFKLLLIQCGIDGFNAIFEKGSPIKPDVYLKQKLQDGDKLYTLPPHLAQNESSVLEEMLNKFQGTKWWFYFYGYNNDGYRVLVKLKFFFKPKDNGIYGVELINTGTDYPSFRGIIRTDIKEQTVIICELRTIEDNMRLLHLKFVNHTYQVPEVLLGTFSNFEGTSIYAGSVVMQCIKKNIKSEFDDKNPETYYYPIKEGEEAIPADRKLIDESNIPIGVKLFFDDKSNNLVKMPSALIKNLNDLKTWKNKKEKAQSVKNMNSEK